MNATRVARQMCTDACTSNADGMGTHACTSNADAIFRQADQFTKFTKCTEVSTGVAWPCGLVASKPAACAQAARTNPHAHTSALQANWAVVFVSSTTTIVCGQPRVVPLR